jgi:hypothetical protein
MKEMGWKEINLIIAALKTKTQAKVKAKTKYG